MEDLIKAIKDFFYVTRLKIIRARLEYKRKKRESYFKNPKMAFNSGVKVTIEAKGKELTERIRNDVDVLVKSSSLDTEKLINYVKALGTPVYKYKNAKKWLYPIAQEQGIVFEQIGLFALYLGLITGNGIRFKTPPMFIISEDIDKYEFIHSFYKWFSMKSGLEGFDYESQQKLKFYMADNSDATTKKLSLDEIKSIESAIKRDQEATAYVMELMKEKDGGKNVMQKIKKEGGAEI